MAEKRTTDKLLKSERRLTNFFATTTSLGAGLLGGVGILGAQFAKACWNIYNAVGVAGIRGLAESTPETGVAATFNEMLHQLPEKLRTPEVQQAFRDKIASFSMEEGNLHAAETPKADAIITKAMFEGHAPKSIQTPQNALVTVTVAAFATAAVTLGAVHLYRKHLERKQQKTERTHSERITEAANLAQIPAQSMGR